MKFLCFGTRKRDKADDIVNVDDTATQTVNKDFEALIPNIQFAYDVLKSLPAHQKADFPKIEESNIDVIFNFLKSFRVNRETFPAASYGKVHPVIREIRIYLANHANDDTSLALKNNNF